MSQFPPPVHNRFAGPGGPGRWRAAGALLLISAYLAATAWFLWKHMLGDSVSHPIAYFFTWDMFPGYYTESLKRFAIGETTSGARLLVHPSPWDQFRGGIRGDLTRIDLERAGLFYRSVVEQ